MSHLLLSKSLTRWPLGANSAVGSVRNRASCGRFSRRSQRKSLYRHLKCAWCLGRQDNGPHPRAEGVSDRPKITLPMSEMGMSWHLAYTTKVLFSPVVLPWSRFLQWSEFMTVTPFPKAAEKGHASAESPGLRYPGHHLHLWFVMSNWSEWARILEQRPTFPPTSCLLEKTTPFSISWSSVWKQPFAYDENPGLKVTTIYGTHCQFNDNIRKSAQ